MSTVRGLRNSSCATSRFVRPTATRRRISSSRGVSPPRSVAAAARSPSHCATEAPSAATLVRGRGGQRPCAELARREVGVAQALEGGLELAGGGERDPGAQLDMRALEGDVERAEDLRGARELDRGGVRVALEQRGLADRMRERAERVGVARDGGDLRQRLRAAVRARTIAAGGEVRRAPAQPPDAEVAVLAVAPAAQQRPAVLGRLLVARPPPRRRTPVRRSSQTTCGSGPPARRCSGTRRASAVRRRTCPGRRGSCRACPPRPRRRCRRR